MALEVNVRDSDNVILQYGSPLPPSIAGCHHVVLTSVQESALATAMSQRNGGITLDAQGNIATLPYVAPAAPTDPAAPAKASLITALDANVGVAVSQDTVNALKAYLGLVP